MVNWSLGYTLRVINTIVMTESTNKKKINVDDCRKWHLVGAEAVDAWRIVPRLMSAGYAYLLGAVSWWYMNLEPKLIEGCDVSILKEACLTNAPTTQHAALVTAIIGISAAVFGLYANTGRKWGRFISWNTPPEIKIKTESEEN